MSAAVFHSWIVPEKRTICKILLIFATFSGFVVQYNQLIECLICNVRCFKKETSFACKQEVSVNTTIRGGGTVSVRLNEDPEIVKTIREGLQRTGGYCPCRLQRTEEFKCMCQEFRDQIKDPEFEGYCHCMLYYKSKD